VSERKRCVGRKRSQQRKSSKRSGATEIEEESYQISEGQRNEEKGKHATDETKSEPTRKKKEEENRCWQRTKRENQVNIGPKKILVLWLAMVLIVPCEANDKRTAEERQ
jgi:hypothetical protein